MSDFIDGPPERDGTAIDWDTECNAVPGTFDVGDLGVIACGLFAWGALLFGLVGAYLGWWLP